MANSTLNRLSRFPNIDKMKNVKNNGNDFHEKDFINMTNPACC